MLEGADFLTQVPTCRSSVVEKMLLEAHAERRIFSVIVVDSRPMLEGMSRLHVTVSHANSST